MLELPADIEPHLEAHDYTRMHGPAVYSLALNPPDDLPTAWDNTFNQRPPYFEELQTAERVVYVGATNNLLGRLEDHKNGDVRVTVLTDIYTINNLHNVWWMPSADIAFERESRIALKLQQDNPGWYIHSR